MALPARSPTVDYATGLACLAVWAAWALWLWWGHWPSDLSAIYFAARFYAEGALHEVYASPERFFGDDYPASWQAAAAALGHPDVRIYPYVYPPLWAALISPLAERLPPSAFFNGVYAWHVGLMAAAPVLAYRLLRPPVSFAVFAGLSAVLLATSVFSRLALFHNQLQITVAFLTLLAFERLANRRDTAAGVALGLAAALKLTPILLLAIFAAERRWRAFAVALASLAALVAASYALAGPELHAVFVAKLRLIGAQIYIWQQNFSLEAVIFLLTASAAGHPMPADPETGFLFHVPGWLPQIVQAFLFGGLALVLWMTRALPDGPRLYARFAAAGLVIVLCSPLAWAHHFTGTLFLLPGLLALWSRPAAIVWIVATGILFASPVVRNAPYWVNPNHVLLLGVAWLLALTYAFARAPAVSRTTAAKDRRRGTSATA